MLLCVNSFMTLIFGPFSVIFYSWPPFRPLWAIFYLVTSSTMAHKARKPFRPLSANLVIVCPLYNGKERKAMHYSMLIQGSSTNGSFTWINPYKYKNPTITSMTVLFRPKEAKAMFNNVDTTNVITNSNDETVTIPAGNYTLSEIIVLLNTMTALHAVLHIHECLVVRLYLDSVPTHD